MTDYLLPGLILGIFVNIICNPFFVSESLDPVAKEKNEDLVASVRSAFYFNVFSRESSNLNEEISLRSVSTGTNSFDHEVEEITGEDPVIVENEPEVSIPVRHSVPTVPFYSQIHDIDWPEWRGRACGVVGLAMIVEMYYPGRTSPQALLERGIESGHFLSGIGWTHNGLAILARENGLVGNAYDFHSMSMDDAYSKLLIHLEKGPVIASVFHGFDPQSPIPHLAVINGVEGDTVYYNDPAEGSGGGRISVEGFKAGWKKRFITAHP